MDVLIAVSSAVMDADSYALPIVHLLATLVVGAVVGLSVVRRVQTHVQHFMLP